MDQADRLRNLIMQKNKSAKKTKFRVITVSSGKGGVGKTNFVINLAVSLRNKGLRITVLDADFGMADIDVLMGIKCNYTIYDMLYGNKHLEDIIVNADDGIKLISGGSGIKELANITDAKMKKLVDEFSKLQDVDILLVDTGAGLSKTVLKFIELADDVLIITNPEPTAITDAYGLIKVIYKNKLNDNIYLVINRVKNIKEAQDTYDKLSKTVYAFLSEKIKYLGFVSDDSKVRMSVVEQKPFFILYPRCSASLCIQKISSEILGEDDNIKNKSIKDYFIKFINTIGR
jgi:flagellar biosynthesis protein FlhG